MVLSGGPYTVIDIESYQKSPSLDKLHVGVRVFAPLHNRYKFRKRFLHLLRCKHGLVESIEAESMTDRMEQIWIDVPGVKQHFITRSPNYLQLIRCIYALFMLFCLAAGWTLLGLASFMNI